METTTRYTIRTTTYRGREGFVLSGDRIRIFAETRGAAEHLRELHKRGIEETVADFAGHTPGLSGYCTGCMWKVA